MQETISRPRLMNQVLAGLPEQELGRLWPRLARSVLRAGQSLESGSGQQQCLYFPETAVVSVIATPDPPDRSLEVAIVGREGVVGCRWILSEVPRPADGDAAVVQVPGIAYVVPVASLRAVLGELPALRARVLAEVAILASQFARSAVCVSNHTIEQRLARRLLLACDRGETNILPVTQEHLARMLSVRRSGVSVVLNLLETHGVLGLARGHITVRDRTALRMHACACYGN